MPAELGPLQACVGFLRPQEEAGEWRTTRRRDGNTWFTFSKEQSGHDGSGSGSEQRSPPQRGIACPGESRQVSESQATDRDAAKQQKPKEDQGPGLQNKGE